jgi:hypothetical protein
MAEVAEMLKDDLTAFANKRTPVEIDVVGASVRAGWRQGRIDRADVFALDGDDRLMWVPADAEPAPYRTFLRSERMADLDALAEAISLKYPVLDAFVPPDATFELAPDDVEDREASLPDTEALIRATLQSRPGLSTVFFVKGDAGAGKTTLLQQLTTRQAKSYAAGESDFLFLNVSAQGRLLSNLPDALAAETQDLSATFRNDAVAVLARNQILVPVIDGFDELLGTAGYTDAFSSLQTLLSDLGGQGVLIVSARSSFYETEFIERGHSFDAAAYRVAPVSLHPWTRSKLEQFIRLISPQAQQDAFVSMLGDLDPGDLELLHRPFFAQAFPAYAEARFRTGSAPPVLDHLIDEYVRREADKVVNGVGQPLLPPDVHRQIFEEAAEQMWLAGDRKLSIDDLRALAEAMAEGANLNEGDIDQFRTKITSYAGFQLDAARDAFGFEHEVYFDYFLARAGARQFGASNAGPFLDGGLLPPRLLASLAGIRTPEVVLDDVETLRSTALQTNRRQNSGSLITAAVRQLSRVEGRTFSNAEFVGEDLTGLVFTRCAFRHCTFFEVDLRQTAFDECEAVASTWSGIMIDAATRFDVKGVDVYSDVSSVTSYETGLETFDPAQLLEQLQAAGLPAVETDQVEPLPLGHRAAGVLELVERLERRFRRTTLIADDDDNGGARIFGHPEWSTARELLERHGLVKVDTRPASGRRKEFLRRAVSFRRLLNEERRRSPPAESPMAAFWADVRRLDE